MSKLKATSLVQIFRVKKKVGFLIIQN
ncbi:hypothetical protein LINPERHAP1_LOCUS43764 [Linum perenne]